jgi:predicted P-loop ATPase
MTKKFIETKIPKHGSNRVVLVKEFLDQHYDIKINIFDHSKVMIASKTKEYTHEISIEDLTLHMLEDGITGSDSILKKIITSPNQTTPYNPIKEYFENLTGKYAGESHIEKLCGYLKPRDYGDKPVGYYEKRLIYTLRKWIVATVACEMDIKENDAMFVVVNNEEGIGKSTLLEFIVPGILKGYYSKSSKEMSFPEMFTSNLLINFDEMLGLTKATAEEFKNIMSSQWINVSKRFTTTRQRYASTCGTSNKDAERGGFLTTDMGTRRFAINHIDAIDWDYIKQINVDQIWAEAVMLLNQDYDYIWNPDDFKEFGEYNSRFIVQTSSYKLIKEFYRHPEPDEQKLSLFKMPVEILRDLRAARKINSSMTTITEINIGIALRQLGYLRYDKKINGYARHGYNVVPLF